MVLTSLILFLLQIPKPQRRSENNGSASPHNGSTKHIFSKQHIFSMVLLLCAEHLRTSSRWVHHLPKRSCTTRTTDSVLFAQGATGHTTFQRSYCKRSTAARFDASRGVIGASLHKASGQEFQKHFSIFRSTICYKEKCVSVCVLPVMDSPTIIKTLKYNPPQKPMFSAVDTSLHYRSFVQENIFTNASFSSYPKPKQNSPENDTEISIFDAQKYFSESNDPKDSKRLSITNQKDASEPSDAVPVPRLSSASSVDGCGRNFRTRSFQATPTASSEASWNSQTGLLETPQGSISVKLRNFPPDHSQKRSSNAKKWIFGRKCCCSGKKCVQVKEERSDSDRVTYANNESHKSRESIAGNARNMSLKNSVPNEMREPRISSENHFASTAAFPQRILAPVRQLGDGTGGFSFPILSPSCPATKSIFKGISSKPISPLEDPPRDSLEVFQPTRKSISRTPMDPQRGPLGGFTMPGSPISGVAATDDTDDDVGSDASSDLFELESFSTQTTSYPMYRRRDSLDDNPTFNARRFASSNGSESTFYGRRSLDEPQTPSIAATECYAPSEVSVDWSVTTAEGFDRASLTNFSISASEIGNVAFLRQRLAEKNGEAACSNGAGCNEASKRKGNGLLSCRHEKAVSVGPLPLKFLPEGPPLPLISTTGHMNGRPRKANKPPLASSYSTGVSLAFAA
ncbi:unnamed protein product [Fraxinus pennsylvanica]|uniref:Protein PHYTOCHROME KINASE SUBSTRATE 4 n=1 Tax=Fraxinus pennsylvanica TaxID=56036 RepID=A0AAD2ACZ1_9LAMI|nr:unnamed protein product [Fraxinus pennsylvanica]